MAGHNDDRVILCMRSNGACVLADDDGQTTLRSPITGTCLLRVELRSHVSLLHYSVYGPVMFEDEGHVFSSDMISF